jgi:NAD(P)-dependent dehydrogenase (short-subunit alcohol dehydrogenase family)
MKIAEAFVDHLASSEQKKLVTISSTLGSIGRDTSGGMYQYRASKAAVNALMKALSVDLAPRGIIVALIHPGWVRTDMGGPDGDVSADISVAGMRQVIAELLPEDSGCFRDYRGRSIDW